MSDSAGATVPVVSGTTPVTGEEEFAAARVLSVGQGTVNQKLLDATGVVANRQEAEVEIIEGKQQGKKVKVLNEITDNPVFNIHIKSGS